MNRIEQFRGRLRDVARSGGGFAALCPAHDDRARSLSFGAGRNGGIVVKCHAGCSAEAIVAALGLTITDLAPNRPAEVAHGQTVYPYVDENGRPLFEVVRFANPKTFRQRKPDGSWGLNGTRRVLYRLPEVLAAATSGQRVYLPEGEKDVDRLVSLGLTATTNPMGAGKWRREYSEALKGAEVIVLADNDEPGRKHASDVAASTPGARVVELPGLAPHGDVSDWFDAGHTLEELLTHVDAAVTASKPAALGAILTVVSRDIGVAIGRENEAPIEAVPSHWPSLNDACRGRGGRIGIARGWVTLIAGGSNKGKTLCALNWTDAALAHGVSVVLVLLEGMLADAYPKLLAMVSGIDIRELEPAPAGHGGTSYSPRQWAAANNQFHERNERVGSTLLVAENPGADLNSVLKALRAGAAAGARLGVVDYVQRVRVDGATGIYDESRKVSGALADLAIRERIALLGLSQLNRATTSQQKKESPTMHGLKGGGSWEDDADLVIVLDHREAERSGYVLRHTMDLQKNRRGPLDRFEVETNFRTFRTRELPVRELGRINA